MRFSLQLIGIVCLFSVVYGTNNATDNDDCEILTLFPFTDRQLRKKPDKNGFRDFTPIDVDTLGFDYTAAVLMAMDHVHAKDGSVVAELSQCEYSFAPPNLVDTRRSPSAVVSALMDNAERRSEYCAILGPFGENSIRNTRGMAATFGGPTILYSSNDAQDTTSPKSGLHAIAMTYTDESLAYDLIVYVETVLQRKYLAVVHGNGDFSERTASHIVNTGLAGNVHVEKFGVDKTGSDSNGDHFYRAFEYVKQSGIGTIYMLYTNALSIVNFAEYLDEFDMLDGDYIFLLHYEAAPPQYFDYVFDGVSEDHPAHKLLDHSIVLTALDGYLWDNDDRFLAEWRQQNSTFVERVKKAMPVKAKIEDDHFSQGLPYTGSSFVYDSVVALALSNCLPSNSKEDSQGSKRPDKYRVLQPDFSTKPDEGTPKQSGGGGKTSSTTGFVEGIKKLSKTEFVGASGVIKRQKRGSKLRDPTGVVIGAYNMRRQADGRYVANFAHLRKNNGAWEERDKIQFANLQSTPPSKDLYVSETNYLSKWARALGLMLFSLCILIGLVALGFIHTYSARQSMKASQPFFLKMVVCGSMATSMSIFTLSFDEGAGWSSGSLSVACSLTPWFFFLGLVTVYSALFAKLWRVDRVLSMRRQTVKVVQVLWPVVLFQGATVLTLLFWSIKDPWVWKRSFLSMIPPVTAGQCQSDDLAAYFGTLSAITMIVTAMAVMVALKVKDVADMLSDNRATTIIFVTHLQAWVVGLPILLALRGQYGSTNAVYLGRVMVIFVFGISATAISILPKCWSILNGTDQQQKSQRVRISGISDVPHTKSMNSVLQQSFVSNDSQQGSFKNLHNSVGSLESQQVEANGEKAGNENLQSVTE